MHISASQKTLLTEIYASSIGNLNESFIKLIYLAAQGKSNLIHFIPAVISVVERVTTSFLSKDAAKHIRPWME